MSSCSGKKGQLFQYLKELSIWNAVQPLGRFSWHQTFVFLLLFTSCWENTGAVTLTTSGLVASSFTVQWIREYVGWSARFALAPDKPTSFSGSSLSFNFTGKQLGITALLLPTGIGIKAKIWQAYSGKERETPLMLPQIQQHPLSQLLYIILFSLG